MKYSLDGLTQVHHMFLPSEAQKQELISEILDLHLFLQQAHQFTSEFPDVSFTREAIQFYNSKVHSKDVCEYCRFIKTSPTPSGKTPKYPLQMNFYIGNVPFIDNNHKCALGEVYYSENGEIGKIRMVVWIDKICYKIQILKKKNETLKITKIEKNGNETNNFRNTILYQAS